MMLYTQNHTIKKFNSPIEIIEEFFPIRWTAYERRKQ